MLSFFLVLGCLSSSEPETTTEKPSVPIVETASLQERLGMDKIKRLNPPQSSLGRPLNYGNYSVTPLSLVVFEDFRISGALFSPTHRTDAKKTPGFLMAHGHFGEGKSSGEAQGPAHLMAAQGYLVLALDTPGVEEGERKDRQIHHEAGAANREALLQKGTSAMAVQLHILQAGLDLLESEKVSWIGVGGASGGGVQAFYLSHIDPRVDALVMASFVSMPRKEGEGVCPCDLIPGGWPEDLHTSLSVPSLWLCEDKEKQKPPTLPKNADFEIHPGNHGFELPMIHSAIQWMNAQHGASNGNTLLESIPRTPAEQLQSPDIGKAGLKDLVDL